jgi:hypothetical protein
MVLRDLLRDQPTLVSQIKEEMQRLLARSATDAAFRRRLLEDPRAAVHEFTGRPVPAHFDLQFVDSEADAVIILPKFMAPGSELSDAELQVVNGGGAADGLANAAFGHLIASLLAAKGELLPLA